MEGKERKAQKDEKNANQIIKSMSDKRKNEMEFSTGTKRGNSGYSGYPKGTAPKRNY